MDYKYKNEVMKAKEGCSKSMERLIEGLKPLIYSAIGRYGRRWETEDLYQDACLILLEAVRDFDEERGVPFLAFVKSRIYYGIHNLTRGDTYEISLDDSPFEGGEPFKESLVDPDMGIEEEVLIEEQRDELNKALRKLTPKQREVIEAHYFEGMKFKDIARQRGSHYKSVLRLKDRGLGELRKLMSP